MRTKEKGSGGASSLQGRHLVKCALHEGVQDFKRGRVCYGLLLGVRDSSERAHEECYVGWHARSVGIEGDIIGCGRACQELRARFRRCAQECRQDA